MLPSSLQALKDAALAAHRAKEEELARHLKAQADEDAAQAAMNQDMLREAIEAELEPEMQHSFNIDLSGVKKDQREFRTFFELPGHKRLSIRFWRDDRVGRWKRINIEGCMPGLLWRVDERSGWFGYATLGEALLAAELGPGDGPEAEDEAPGPPF